MADISNTADMLDVRDIIARVEELREEQEALRDALGAAQEAHQEAESAETVAAEDEAASALEMWEASEEGTELATLESLLSDLKGKGGDEQWEGDWYPITLIRETYFEEAMDELLEDAGDLPRDLPPYLKITVDYDALRTDYTFCEFEGVTYLYR